MNPQIENAIHDFIGVSITRMANSGITQYQYHLSIKDLARVRVNPTFISDCVSYIQSRFNINSVYNDISRGFEVFLDLNTCVLNARESDYYQAAYSQYNS